MEGKNSTRPLSLPSLQPLVEAKSAPSRRLDRSLNTGGNCNLNFQSGDSEKENSKEAGGGDVTGSSTEVPPNTLAQSITSLCSAVNVTSDDAQILAEASLVCCNHPAVGKFLFVCMVAALVFLQKVETESANCSFTP